MLGGARLLTGSGSPQAFSRKGGFWRKVQNAHGVFYRKWDDRWMWRQCENFKRAIYQYMIYDHSC